MPALADGDAVARVDLLRIHVNNNRCMADEVVQQTKKHGQFGHSGCMDAGSDVAVLIPGYVRFISESIQL